ncbi:Putative transcriptional regulator OS=Streptomyces glaucescens OX=1907 GN=SGLAU_26770 PE=4 SV=1 [Streptomyces glaucescens]
MLQALGAWGQDRLGERQPTDAVRAHWFALPLLRALDGQGLVQVSLEEGQFHLFVGAQDGPLFGDGPAPGEPDARLVLDTGACTAIARGELSLADAVRDGRVTVTGDGTIAKALTA